MLIAWSNFAYTVHIERSPPDHDSPAQFVKEVMDHSGTLEEQCDHCCHGGSHMQALCSEQLTFAAFVKSDFAPEAPMLLRSRATPPITPPPQA